MKESQNMHNIFYDPLITQAKKTILKFQNDLKFRHHAVTEVCRLS